MNLAEARTATRPAAPAAALPARSAWASRLFGAYARRYVARHFHAVRLSREGYRPGPGAGGPLLVVLNHPSWWDPLLGQILAGLWTDRVPYAPIDAAALRRYPFLARLGLFGIEPGTTRGALAFLRRGRAVLGDPGSMLWVTAQGRFTDPRASSEPLKPGVGHLLHRLESGTVVPLALEYPFWDERTPEALARFGTPVGVGSVGPRRSPEEWSSRLGDALRDTQDALADDALSRDPDRFETIVSGAAGVGGVYDGWRRLKASARGERFVAGHRG